MKILTDRGGGAGFVVSHDGRIVTNYHVIEDVRSATVEFDDGMELPVRGVVASNPGWDLAVVIVSYRNLSFLRLADDELPAIGASAIAIGSPRGMMNSLSDGKVAGHPRMGGLTYIQTTAPISPGASGGPLLLGEGRVVGVTTASRQDWGIQNMNFAVPAQLVRRLLKSQHAVRPLPLARLRTR